MGISRSRLIQPNASFTMASNAVLCLLLVAAVASAPCYAGPMSKPEQKAHHEDIIVQIKAFTDANVPANDYTFSVTVCNKNEGRNCCTKGPVTSSTNPGFYDWTGEALGECNNHNIGELENADGTTNLAASVDFESAPIEGLFNQVNVFMLSEEVWLCFITETGTLTDCLPFLPPTSSR